MFADYDDYKPTPENELKEHMKEEFRKDFIRAVNADFHKDEKKKKDFLDAFEDLFESKWNSIDLDYHVGILPHDAN